MCLAHITWFSNVFHEKLHEYLWKIILISIYMLLMDFIACILSLKIDYFHPTSKLGQFFFIFKVD